MTELVLLQPLVEALPDLSPDESAQLEANILRDGKVLEPICWTNLNGKKVVIDGMHRYRIARRRNVPFEAIEVPDVGQTVDELRDWIIVHAYGKRGGSRVVPRSAFRAALGRLARRKRLAGATQRSIARQTGTSDGTVRAAMRRAELLEQLPVAARRAIERGAFEATDEELEALVRLSPEQRDTVLRDVRVGRVPSLGIALREVAALARIAKDRSSRSRLARMQYRVEDLEALAKFRVPQQREILSLGAKNLADAIETFRSRRQPALKAAQLCKTATKAIGKAVRAIDEVGQLIPSLAMVASEAVQGLGQAREAVSKLSGSL